MTRKEYNKLVRDRIPEIIRQCGRECETFIMSEEQYKDALKMKLVEEAEEVVSAKPEELIKELGDIFEVIDGILEIYRLDRDSIVMEQKKRKEERGDFSGRTCLVWAETEEQTFPLIVGAETKEGRERINSSLEKRNHLDYECMRLLKQLLSTVEPEKLRDLLNAADDPQEAYGGYEFLEVCEKKLKERDEVNQEFLKAIAGIPD